MRITEELDKETEELNEGTEIRNEEIEEVEDTPRLFSDKDRDPIKKSSLEDFLEFMGASDVKKFWGHLTDFAKRDPKFSISLLLSSAFLIPIIMRVALYAYYSGILSVYRIDPTYIKTDENSLFGFVYYLAVAVVIFLMNYIFLWTAMGDGKRSPVLRILHTVLLMLAETIFIAVFVFFELKTVIPGYFGVLWQAKREIFSLLRIMLLQSFAVVLITNSFGMAAVIIFAFQKPSEKVHRDRTDQKTDPMIGQPKNESKYSVELIAMVIIMSASLLVFKVSAIWSERERTEYKLVCEVLTENQREEIEEKYLFFNDGKPISVFPVVFENEEVYILSRLYRAEDGGIKMDYDYQKVIGKLGVETYFVKDIFSEENYSEDSYT